MTKLAPSSEAPKIDIVVSPTAHFRVDVGRVLRRAGLPSLLLRNLTQLRPRRLLFAGRLVVLEVEALPGLGRSDAWTRSLVADPYTHRLKSCDEAVSLVSHSKPLEPAGRSLESVAVYSAFPT